MPYFEPEKPENTLFSFDKTYQMTVALFAFLALTTVVFFRINIGWRYLSLPAAVVGCLMGSCLIAIGDQNKCSPILPYYTYAYVIATLFQWYRANSNRRHGKHYHSYFIGECWTVKGGDNAIKLKRERWLKLGLIAAVYPFSGGLALLLAGDVVGELVIFTRNKQARDMMADDAVDAMIDNEELAARYRRRQRLIGNQRDEWR